MNKMEARAKALELTLKMFSIFSQDDPREELKNISKGSCQHILVDAARIFELYIMNGS
ncbi:MAG: hypothetical protein LBI67_08975 [Treponema sp.]|jgi:hypothetical protein|nr:hypothetical protein [Treponema sp.]